MTSRILSGMPHATALTRAGKLTEATAYIQQMLGTAPAPAGAPLPDGDVIEGEFFRLEPAPASPVQSETPGQPEPRAQAELRMQPGPLGQSTPIPSPAKPRRPLGQTLQYIARGGMPAATVRPRTDGAIDPQMTSHTHSGPQGSRDYLLFVPAAAPDQLRPVIVMLHGCTQTPQDFATGTGMNRLAAAQGCIVVYPAQPNGANMNKCWNWFRPTDQERDAGEPAILAGILREVLASHACDPARVYVAGLSAGGAAAVILAQAYPDLFAAVGVHSGLAAGAARDVPSAFAAMRNGAAGQAVSHAIPTIVFHGTADTTVDVKNAAAVAGQARARQRGKSVVTRGKAGRAYTNTALTAPDGRTLTEVWLIDGAGHAWAGGDRNGSFTDPAGPDASAQMLRFFSQHRLSST